MNKLTFRTLSFLFIFSLVSFTLNAQTAWTIQSGSIDFEINNAGIPVDGSFGDLKGDLIFSPDRLGAVDLKASVGVHTLETGIGSRDEHLRKEEYFHLAKHPRINMEAVKVESKGGNNYSGTFRLTMKGTSRLVTIPFTFQQDGDKGTFQGKFAIDRRDYGVGGNSFIMGDEVRISIKVNVTKQTNG
ncbi:MAG: YceI family protein [Bacteroidota bacterium]